MNLSPRQQDVVRGLLRGLSNKAIASDLGLSPETVKVYMRDAMRRAGVSSRLQLALLAQRGLT